MFQTSALDDTNLEGNEDCIFVFMDPLKKPYQIVFATYNYQQLSRDIKAHPATKNEHGVWRRKNQIHS